ncbi:glutathione S-transferase family protein [Sphingomonas turrisvirgatae]|uniref:Glutathione S-transferase n=1 Tax=Sphingomonas turrisvirgatae TaxID=1888892 RepID=A0A1E3LRS8_9SPHN|nr:glutathione S-transferase family protein [Sphingomonas turrisvirgatae]ODP36423.1 glutathione S-transferase [Sphingomonas turrisvirgatae]
MIFYDSPSPAPNPRRVRIFAAEKGIELPTEQVSILKGEHKSDAFRAINPLGQTPALKLDDGTVITESVAICRYLEALHPDPPLFGRDALDAARIEMWSRRIELRLMAPTGMIWVHTHPFTARVVPHQYKDFGESNRPAIERAHAMFDEAFGETPYIAGEHYSIADILLLTTIDFGTFIGLAIADDLARLNDWHRRVSARASAAA